MQGKREWKEVGGSIFFITLSNVKLKYRGWPRCIIAAFFCVGGEGLGHITKYFCSFHSKNTKFRDPEILLRPVAQNFLQVPHLVKKYKKPRKNLDFLYLVGGEGLEHYMFRSGCMIFFVPQNIDNLFKPLPNIQKHPGKTWVLLHVWAVRDLNPRPSQCK